MKPNVTTPQRVVDAIQVVAAYLRDIEAAEAVIAPTGGASFHPERMGDRLLNGWGEERERLRAALAGLVSTESTEELRAMEAVIRISAVPDADKAAMMNAIHALLES